jgi:hypothetical protein
VSGLALILEGAWTETDQEGFNYYGFATRHGVEGPLFDSVVVVINGETRFFYKERDA